MDHYQQQQQIQHQQQVQHQQQQIQHQHQHQHQQQQQNLNSNHSNSGNNNKNNKSNNMKNQRQAAMLKQHRDQAAYSEIPENHSDKKILIGRQPSDLIQAELSEVSPIMGLPNFKPALDEFLKNGPSSDVETIKNLAAEIAAMSSQLDAGRISTEIDASMGIGESQKFGRMGESGNLGFSINSFSSLVDFGDLGDTAGGNGASSGRVNRNLSWQKSVSDLMPADNESEKFHKEYKCFESNDKKRLTSKDWTIDYSMNTTTFTPTNEASTELTNNVVTCVQLNDLNGNTYHQQPQQHTNINNDGLARLPSLRDDKRQMSVEINTAHIGIDPEGRLGSYELIKTELKMEPSELLDPTPLSPQGYRVDNNYAGVAGRYGEGALNPPIFEQQVPQIISDAALSNNFQQQQQQQYQVQPNHGFHAQTPYMQQQQQHEQHQSQLLEHLHCPNPISQSQPSIGTQIQRLGLVVPPRSDMHVLKGGTGVIDHQEIEDADVLLERGGKGNHHKGSRYYRRLINERRPSYQELPDSARAEKMAISLSVVMSVKATGARFIHKKKGQYIVMSDREARNKISQALREKKERVMLDA